MVQAHHDSSFEISFEPIGGNGRSARDGTSPGGKVDELPMLDLNSSGPMPEFLPERPFPIVPQHVETTSLAALSLPKVNGDQRRGGANVWLQGDVLMCPCPDCSAPMSVRIWLMVADCWKCGTSIELSEEQEREANRLLREREEALQRQRPKSERQPREVATTGAVAGGGAATATVEAKLASPATHSKTGSRSEPPVARTGERSPQQRQRENPAKRQAAPRRTAAADRAIGARARVRKMAASSALRVWISDMFGNMPAWLVSFVFHVVLLIILSLLFIVEKEPEVDILLSTEVSTEQKEGGDTQAQLATDDVIFDLPVPNEDWKKDDTKREVLIKADQEARELRLDPNDPTPDLPPLAKVQNLLKSQDTVRRTFAARDPRMRVEMVTAEGGTTLTEAAVARALRFLASRQNEDGGWGLTMGRSDAAGTSLALLPFLGAGQTHQTGVYKDNVAIGLRWLIQHQDEDGDLRSSLKKANSGMYAHGQGAIVLSEAYALTGDEQLRGPAQQAVDFIIDAQHVGGGWRYQPKQAGDTSVLGWQLMALHSAKVSGLTVPESNVELAGNYLDSVQSAAGAKYSYTRGAAPTETMSAEGLLCRMYTGWTKRDPSLEEGLDDLLAHHAPNANKPNIYYWYYGTQVAHHMGGAQWDDWNTRMRDILVESQIDGGKFAGAWKPRGPHTNGNDYIYMTALATCCLEVYYRHAPLFRQIELEEGVVDRP